MKNPFLRFIANIFGMVFTAMLLGMIALALIFYHYSQELPDYNTLSHYDPATVTRLYSADSKLLAEYAVEKRIFVPLTAVPKRVTQAFISAEDKDFYTNTGIDYMGLMRAVKQNLENIIRGGHNQSGGSTITQQVVKNFLLTPEKSYTRKIKEAILAYRITQVYSKDRIMELYLNEIYLGKGSYGVAAAAINYFNKSLNELSIEEAAMLAALPKEPARIDPSVHPDRAKERRDWVISRMAENGYITADEARAATVSPIALRERDHTETANAEFFAEEVRREVAAKYGTDTLYKGGLFVKTTLDPTLQSYSDNALRLALREYDHRHGYRGPLTRVGGEDWKKQLADLTAKHRWPLFDGEQLAAVVEVGQKPAVAFSDGKKVYLDKTAIDWTKTKGLHVGDVVIAAPGEKETITTKGKKKKEKPVVTETQYYTIHQVPEVNGAMIVMDPHTGKVLAMSGGYSVTEFNRATQAKRQPGSSFKPFVYLSAMENGFTPSSMFEDAPVELDPGGGQPIYKPGNFSDEYFGMATLRLGLEKSRNAMTIRLAQQLGLDKVVEIGKRFGIYDSPPAQFSMVLGAQETTLIRLANAYSIIANGGKKVSPFLIERIDDKTGKTILRSDARVCDKCKLPEIANVGATDAPILPDDRAQIVDPRDDYQIVSMLQGVAERGTGARARIIGKTVAGKTGTTNDSRDTWFMGFSPDLVAGIYVGFDQPRTMGKKETGASVALPGFIDFMQHAMKDVPNKPFHVPPGIMFVRVNSRTGQPPMPGDQGATIMEAFKEGDNSLNRQAVGPDGVTPTTPSAPLPAGGPVAAPDYQFPDESPAPAPDGGHWQPAPATSEGTGGLY